MNVSTRTAVAILVIAIIILVVVLRFISPPPPPAVEEMKAITVLHSRESIEPGVPILTSDLFYSEVITVPASQVASYISVSPEALLDKEAPLCVSRYLRPGEPLRAQDVLRPEDCRLVQDWDLEVISFPADFNKVVGGQLWPGQRINIYLYAEAEEATGGPRGENRERIPAVELLADHVWVVDVRSASGGPTGLERKESTGSKAGESTPVTNEGGFLGLGVTLPGATGGGGANAPAGIITVAMDHLKARRLVELMGSMGYRAWVSLSPRVIVTLTPTPPRTATPTPSVTPSPSPTYTPTATLASAGAPSTPALLCDPLLTVTPSSGLAGTQTTVSGSCGRARAGERVDIYFGEHDLCATFGDAVGRYTCTFRVPDLPAKVYMITAKHLGTAIGWGAFELKAPSAPAAAPASPLPTQPTAPAALPTATPVRPPAVASPEPTATAVAKCDYLLLGTEMILVGGYGDNMDYDGSDTTPRRGGLAQVHVDACADRLLAPGIIAEFEVREGESPLRPAEGISLWGTVKLIVDRIEGYHYGRYGGVAGHVENANEEPFLLAGDPSLEQPYLPKVKADLAAWGVGHIEVDGKIVYKDLRAFVMHTVQAVRVGDRYEVYNSAAKTQLYDPTHPEAGYVADGEEELHFWFYDDRKDDKNLPPQKVFVNAVYRTVKPLLAPKTGATVTLPKGGE